MITLNFRTVEELLMPDKKIRDLLPDLQRHFDTWRVGKISPALRATARKAVLDLLKELTNEHLAALAEYFGDQVLVERVEYNIVKSFESTIGNLDEYLNHDVGYQGFSVSLKGGKAHVLFWR